MFDKNLSPCKVYIPYDPQVYAANVGCFNSFGNNIVTLACGYVPISDTMVCGVSNLIL